MILNFHQFNESLKFKDKTLFIDDEYDKNAIINTQLGKKLGELRTTGLPDVKVYSVYAKNTSGLIDSEDTITSTEVLRMLKGKSELGIVDAESLNKFIDRASGMLAEFLSKGSYDMFVSVESSSSLVSDFMKLVTQKLGTSGSIIFEGKIFKNLDPANITIDNSKMSDETYKTQCKILEKIQDTGYFSIQKFKMQFRQFIHGWMDTKLHVAGKRVVIFDDYLSSGSTMQESARLLRSLGAKDVIGITILK